MNLKEYLKMIEKFEIEYLENAHANQYILGVSGGVDSSLVAAITRKAVGKDRLTCILIPIESDINDLKDGIEVCKHFDINYFVYDATESFHKMVEEFNKLNIDLNVATLANMKARIRMTILYAYAQKVGGLVLGTDNLDERYTGYFTKYGDGACDILPIARLTKGEVVEASKLYGLNDKLANRIPSAGLFEGQTDEKEMGVLYKDLDNYLLGMKIDENSTKRIEHLHKISEHKRVPIPMPEEFIRKNEK